MSLTNSLIVPQTVKSAASFKEWSPPGNHLNSINSLFLAPATPEEIIFTVRTFENKGPGDDGISVKLLKAVVRTTATALAHILNLSFDTGVYPDKLKISHIIPVFKAGDAMLCNNYRPISILSSINKVFEKILFKRMTKFFEKYKLLSNCQFGFRTGKSTEHALADVVNEIKDALNSNEYCIGFFLDMTKAFDILDHEVLFKKLEWLE